jgi:hypothetical protein
LIVDLSLPGPNLRDDVVAYVVVTYIVVRPRGPYN